MATALLGNYLYIPKSLVKGSPSDWAPEWEYEIDLLKTPEGKIAQQQIAFLREQAALDGEDPDEIAAELTADDKLYIANWSDAGDYWALCRGDIKKTQALVDRLNIPFKDKTISRPFDFEGAGLKMLVSLRENQIPVVDQWFKAGYGMLKAAPAFGKTICAIDSILRWKQWTIVLVPTDVLADQFITRFRKGNRQPDGSYVKVTNCEEVEEQHGIELIGRYRSPDRLYPVTVATWQSFIHDAGKQALKLISKKFGRLLADECHAFAARSPAEVVNGFAAKTRQAMSATPTRKDQLDIVLPDIFGPVTAVGDADQLPFSASIIFTGCNYPPRRYARVGEWAHLLNWLVKQEARNDLIKEWLTYDVSCGRSIIVISERVQWCLTMAEEMTRAGIPSRAVIGGMTSKKGLAERDAASAAMMAEDIRIIFATSVFKAGVDIPRCDTIYGAVPQSNREQLEQTVGRCRRPHKGKQKPMYRYFADEGHGLLYGCANSTKKSLLEMGADLSILPKGRKPGQALPPKEADGEEAPEPVVRKPSKLKRASQSDKAALAKLFSDNKNAEWQSQQYRNRMGNKKGN